jgi:hypothetical protein
MLRHSAIAAVAAAGLAVAGRGTAALAHDGPQHHASEKVTGGKVSVNLNAASVTALLASGLSVSPTGKATFSGVSLSFPVAGGTYSKTGGTIDESGGITLSKGSTSVNIKNLRVNLKTRKGTGVVTGHGRISAVTVTKPSSTTHSGHKVTISGYTVKMSKRLISLLDKAFSTTLFAKHPTLGAGTTTLKVKK